MQPIIKTSRVSEKMTSSAFLIFSAWYDVTVRQPISTLKLTLLSLPLSLYSCYCLLFIYLGADYKGIIFSYHENGVSRVRPYALLTKVVFASFHPILSQNTYLYTS